MKTVIILISLPLLIISIPSRAQVKGKKHSLSFVAQFPLGDFSETHFIGAGVQYAPANVKFGLFKMKRLSLSWCGGAEYFIGKKEIVSGYEYRYRNYIFLYGMGNVLYKPDSKMTASIGLGPAMSIFHNNARFNLAGKFELEFYPRNKFGISPGIYYMKDFGTDAIWAASLKGSWLF